MFKKLIALFSGTPKRVNNFEILFGHHTAGKGTHGVIVGTWVSEGKPRETSISFFFDGMDHPPKLSTAVMEELFHHARCAGIVPTHLYSYGNLAPMRRSNDPRDTITPMNHVIPMVRVASR